MYVSVSLRLSLEGEAANMVEHLGAFVPHRSAPVAVKAADSLRIVRAPAISGQAIAYGYHVALAMLVEGMKKEMKLPLCDECENYRARGGFTKRSTQDPSAFKDGEFEVISKCVIEDLTGFLIVGKGGKKSRGKGRGKRQEGSEETAEASEEVSGIRRTSPVKFSYLLPDHETGKFRFEPQFHVRYNFAEGEHAPFTIENTGAVYTLAIAVDVEAIGRGMGGDGKINSLSDDERRKRIELAFEGLRLLFSAQLFGARKSRNLPRMELLGGVTATASPLPFMVPPAVGRDYVLRAAERAKALVSGLGGLGIKEKISIAYFDTEGLVKHEELEKHLEIKHEESEKAGGAAKDIGITLERVESFDGLVDWLKRGVLG